MSNSSTSTKLNISSLDFDGIKTSLQNYLQAQSEFQDYNFAGSGLSVILNILAYNTHYLSYYLNMVGNEMFLDSADRRENIVSIAKQLGYLPISRKSAQATINILITPPLSPTPPAYLTIPIYTPFNTLVNGVTYTFVTMAAITVPYNAINNTYSVNNVLIQEGIPYTFTYTVDTNNPVPYIIPNSSVDTNTLTVVIQDSSQSALLTTFNLLSDLNLLDGTTNVYFLQEIDNEQYEVYFGDGILGKALVDGNIVYLTYLACNADAPNLANIFTTSGNIGGYNNITLTTVNPAAGGAERETIDSIRFTAPQNYQTQNRAVTENDYETIITREYPNVDSIAVWGGETNIPPHYGTVYLSLKPASGYVITELTKQNIVTNILQSRNIVSIIPVIVDPDYIFLLINSLVKYNARATNLTTGQLQNNVITTIQNFAETNIGHFGDIFRYSQLTREIDATDPSITNDLTTILLQKQFIPPLNVIDTYTLMFSNSLVPGTLTSGSFVDSTDPNYSVGQLYFFDDDSKGSIRTYKFIGPTKTYTNLNAGTIDYIGGIVILTSFKPSTITDVTQTMKVTVQSQINDITPKQNQIIVVNPTDIVVNMQVNN